MPEYQTPGVYIEELPSGIKSIDGVSTSTAAFVGLAERGPLTPQLVTSWQEFQLLYGGFVDDSYLAYAVQGFFENGGRRCLISRVVRQNSTCAFGNIDGQLNIVAVAPGAWGNFIKITVEKASRTVEDIPQNRDEEDISRWVKISITGPDSQEVFDNLTIKKGSRNYVADVINASSKYVRVWLADGFADNSGLTESRIILKGGDDGSSPLTVEDFTGSAGLIVVPVPDTVKAPPKLLGRRTGFTGLETIDEVSLVIAPDQARYEYYDWLSNLIVAHCERLKDRFAILSTRPNQSDVFSLYPPHDSSYAGFYYPWIKVLDPVPNMTKEIPAVGHIAGVFARTDMDRGVHQAPANEVLYGAVDLEFPVTTAMQDTLNPRGVNCIRDFRANGRGIRLWGARTMSSDPEWRYVNVRRLLLYLEESIREGTQWVVFEPNDEPLWAQVRLSISAFLMVAWRNGALMGTKPDEAFFVACDRTTMTQNDIDSGRLICVVGFAPIKPAEFVIIRIGQKTADAPA